MKEKISVINSHPFPPVMDENSLVLILGSFPSVKSREDGFYYANKTNRFFKVLSEVFNEEEPLGTPNRKAFLLKHHIALYDSYSGVSIKGSSDSSLVGKSFSRLEPIFQKATIKKVMLNGKKALEGYLLNPDKPDIPYVSLPSTSAANASMSLAELVKIYGRELSSIEGLL